MTTKVTIKNDSDPTSLDHHIIEVIGGDGQKTIVPPGRSVTTIVWLGTQIQVTELEVKGERRGGDGGYGALPPPLHD